MCGGNSVQVMDPSMSGIFFVTSCIFVVVFLSCTGVVGREDSWSPHGIVGRASSL